MNNKIVTREIFSFNVESIPLLKSIITGLYAQQEQISS